MNHPDHLLVHHHFQMKTEKLQDSFFVMDVVAVIREEAPVLDPHLGSQREEEGEEKNLIKKIKNPKRKIKQKEKENAALKHKTSKLKEII